MTNTVFLPVIMQGQAAPQLPLGCQIEHHQASSVKQWVIPARQYQIPVKWRNVETVPGELNWSAYEADFAALAGQRVTVGIKVVPEWARLWAGYVASPPKPECYVDLAHFLLALIERYHPDAIELFNEPDVDRDAAKWAEEFFGAWCVNNDFYRGGRLYGQCLDTVYPILHEAYPGVRIIAGALMAHESSLKFLDGMIAGGLQCDAVSFHKYVGLGGNFNAAFEFALSVTNRINKPIVLSETSITATEDSDLLRTEQADYLKYLLDNVDNSSIECIQIYSLANNAWMNSDLVRNNQPTPMYNVWIKHDN
jgi:hypothetical protein